MNAILEEVGKIGIVPVIKIDDAEKAVPLAQALLAGGIPCIELTFRTAQGEEAIRRIAAAMPNMLVGAGTVLTVDQVDRAINAGAKFIVSPGFNPKVVAHCVQKGVPVTPGCATPSDVEQAIEFGLEVVKFFPAEQAGGIDYIKAISAPYPNIKFMPTGGINAANIAKYMSFDKVLACGGSWIATAELINAGGFAKITTLSQEAVLNLLGLCIANVGINAGGEEAAASAARLINTVFGFALKDSGGSIFVGEAIELLKTNGPGSHGHIAIGTNSIPRALAHLERNGILFNYDSAKKDAQGKVTAVYLKEEILGFAVHLVQRK
jgi:2-dehydro-3-deoxyphosphogluconate aldolase/(4S)-4-hydroxy-2-oxoglutarate aldolase